MHIYYYFLLHVYYNYLYLIFNLNKFYNSSILNHYSIIVYHNHINIIMLTNINKQNNIKKI